jgi:hydrogenase maturation protease
MRDLARDDTLLFALGNAGRGDDGLGWAFAKAVEARGFPAENIHVRYHLQVEDAERIAEAGRVLFVDACRERLPGGFEVRPCEPAATFAFTTHSVSPEAILFVCRELYGRSPDATCLLIAGEAWELGTGLSEAATRNLRIATSAFTSTLRRSRRPSRGRLPPARSARRA